MLQSLSALNSYIYCTVHSIIASPWLDNSGRQAVAHINKEHLLYIHSSNVRSIKSFSKKIFIFPMLTLHHIFILVFLFHHKSFDHFVLASSISYIV
jgi:hypothetical protein